jgi:hypothetical protein
VAAEATGVGAAVDAVVTEEELLVKSLKEMLVLALVVSLRAAVGEPSWTVLLRKEWWC